MIIQLTPQIALESYDPGKPDHMAGLEEMFLAYLLEELDRIGELAFGNPVAGYLSTFIIRRKGIEAGFLSVDVGRFSVELIYVKEEYRGKHIATLALEEFSRRCPTTLELKTPLSPGGEALAQQLGLGRAENFPGEEAKNVEALRTMETGIKATCPHAKKRGGDPRKPCKRCYQKALGRYAESVIIKGSSQPRVL